jgi:membrane protein YqaA with SNARE-associated domain
VRAFISSFFGYFLTPAGLFAMGVLDSSLVFFMPMGLDFVVILMAARNPELAWLYAILAAAGGVVGSGFTFWIGSKLGEHGLSRIVDRAQLERVQKRVRKAAAPSLAALAIIPPPFPLTPFILAAGAFKLNRWRFFGSLAAFKLLRYGTESALAVRFGRGITEWMDSTVFQVVVGLFILLVIVGTIGSAVVMVRKIRRSD